MSAPESVEKNRVEESAGKDEDTSKANLASTRAMESGDIDTEKKREQSRSTHIIVAMYFTTFEGLIVYRNTRWPCYVSKKAYSFCV